LKQLAKNSGFNGLLLHFHNQFGLTYQTIALYLLNKAILSISLKLFFPLYAAGHGSFSQITLFLFVLTNAGAFWSAKVPKTFCQSGKVAPHRPTLIKKKAALCLISFCLCFFWLIEPFGICVQYP